MATTSITNSGPSSFIYNDRYFGHALVKPTLRCWEIISAPLDNQSRLTSIVTRGLATVGLLFSTILFVPGLICKSIDYLISPPAGPGQVFTQTTSDAQQTIQISPPITVNPPVVGLVMLAQGDPGLMTEAQKLAGLQTFVGEPIQSNYNPLPLSARYLIAGRYTYPVTYGWSISTRYSLMERLEEDFQNRVVDRPRLAQGAREAVHLQEKILFAKILLKTLDRRGNIEPLARTHPQIFDEIKQCLWKGYGSPQNRGNDFGGDILRTRPNDRLTTDTIRRAMQLWESAHYDISFFDFR